MLVELGEDADGSPPVGRTARPRRPWWPALLVVVAVVLVTAQVVTDARERARVAALARVPGVLAPLPGPPREVWWLDRSATGDVEVVGSLLLEERAAADGALSVAARDVGTGVVRWEVTLLEAAATPLPEGTARYGLQCAPGLPGRLVCLVNDATGTTAPTDGPGAVLVRSTPATSADVVVVDLATGDVGARYPAGSGAVVAAGVGVVGDVVVLAAPLDDGTSVWALDPATGAERWRVVAGTGFGGGWLRWGAEVRVVPVGDDAVGVLGAGAVLLSASDGSTSGTVGTLGTVPGALPDGSALVAGVEGYVRLLHPDGDVRLDGAPVQVTVDDGSVPHLALTTFGGLRAWDATTGAERWRARNVVGLAEALVLGGRAHVHDGHRVTTFDARTGDVLWGVTVSELADAPMVVTDLATDGAHLLVAGLDAATGRATLVALDAADGAPRWHVDLPAWSSVEDVDGVLLATSPEGTAVLR